ncbi:MAG TPA: ABC transporter permease [Bacteroidales bacterium]|nr:ABC transporter permease [Bacteroidales bacterium]HPT02872.1 ABC transporter permease [Bacteroidales bacterium]
MNKIFLIIRREYLTRVRKRSFIIMTILGPVLMAALFIVPIYFATMQDEKRIVHVVDETGLFISKFVNSDNYNFIPQYTDLETAKKTLKQTEGYALLYIPRTEMNVPSQAMLYSDKQPSLNLKSYITGIMNREIEKQKLAAEIRNQIRISTPGYEARADSAADNLMSETILKNIKTDVKLLTYQIEEGGTEKKSFAEVNMIVGMVASIMIYLFIFMFGSQLMRGVIEEKTSRIVEVIVSSVKPFQLMAGKIIGVALVGLTQFVLWIVFTAILVGGFQQAFPEKFKMPEAQQKFVTTQQIQPENPGEDQSANLLADTGNETANQIFEAIASINFPLMILSFLFFFIGGYLLYGAMFAAIGSAVDNEADTQQFMLPVTVPLILAIVMMQYVINNPEGSLSWWLSMIPFTSPVIMMIRIPFGVPYGQLALSAALLIAGFIATTWLAAKIYRTGILMYGKKVNYGELWKWIRYKG